MLTIKPSTPAAQPFPWQRGRACHEYRAMGLELELIELVHRRELATAYGDGVDSLDERIDEVLAALAAEATTTEAA